MPSVFLAGSRKFYKEVEQAQAAFRAAGVRAGTAGKSIGADTEKSEKAALLRAFKRIDSADALYVVAPDGYAGRTVCMEIAYAWARGKPVYKVYPKFHFRFMKCQNFGTFGIDFQLGRAGGTLGAGAGGGGGDA